MSWSCPRCGRPLVDLACAAGVTLGCESCGGVWLDDAAYEQVREHLFARILEKSSASTPAARCDQTTLACPECSAAMAKTSVAGVNLDHCPRHGTWFDPGELEGVCAAISQARSRAIVGNAYQPHPTTDRRTSPADSAVLREQVHQMETMLYAQLAIANLTRDPRD